MKKILFVVTEIKSANGICAKNVMQDLVSQKVSVYCLTNKIPEISNGEIKDGIKYFTVKPRWLFRMEEWQKHSKANSVIKKFLRLFCHAINKCKLMLTCHIWPLISPLYTLRMYLSIKKIYNTYNISTIVCIYSQIDTLLAGFYLKKRYLHVKYILYFLDALSGGYGPKLFSEEWKIKHGQKWEKKFFPIADKIIIMQSAREHYKKYYEDQMDVWNKMVFLDLPLFYLRILDENKEQNILDKSKINIVFLGNIVMDIRNPRNFFEMFEKIDNDKLEVTIIGNNTNNSYFRELTKKDKRVRLLPATNHENAISIMMSADFLLNFGNNILYMTPSKVFEYMSTGKPIISTAPIRNEPSIVYLNKYNNKIIIYEDISQNINISKLKNFINMNFGKIENIELLKDSFYYNTPEACSKILMQ